MGLIFPYSLLDTRKLGCSVIASDSRISSKLSPRLRPSDSKSQGSGQRASLQKHVRRRVRESFVMVFPEDGEKGC